MIRAVLDCDMVVTGNTRHLTPFDGYAGLRIVSPAVFLAELDVSR